MIPLNKPSHQKILDMKVGVKVWMSQLHYIKNHDHFTSPCKKFILQTCHPKNIPISQLPLCSAPLIDLLKRWYILSYIRKQLIWRWCTSLLLTQHSRGRRWWHGRTLPNSISWWWFMDGKTSSREVTVNTWRCPTWSVPLSMSIWFKSATLCPRGHCAVHRSQWHPHFSIFLFGFHTTNTKVLHHQYPCGSSNLICTINHTLNLFYTSFKYKKDTKLKIHPTSFLTHVTMALITQIPTWHKSLNANWLSCH